MAEFVLEPNQISMIPEHEDQLQFRNRRIISDLEVLTSPSVNVVFVSTAVHKRFLIHKRYLSR
jgi:hypothetical protein